MMEAIRIRDMDLEQIADSGQTFTWERRRPGVYTVNGFGRCVEISQQGDLFAFSCDEEEFDSVWKEYFDLERDYGVLKREADPEDRYLRDAMEFGHGIRVLKQDLWEVTVSFLISQNNNISRIRGSIQALCREFGREGIISGTNRSFRAFPRPQELAEVSVSQLTEAGLGYRAKYLARLVESVCLGELSLEELRRASYDEAMKRLLEVYGIGKKVADCICLFGLGHLDAFPVDTHIRGILDQHYSAGFPTERYAGALGILQQYLFYYDLHGTRAGIG